MPPPDPDGLLLFERLVRIETKLDSLVESYTNTVADHEARIRRLERVMWVAVGAAGIIGGLIGQLIPPLIVTH